VTAYDANGVPLAGNDSYYSQGGENVIDMHADGSFVIDNDDLPQCLIEVIYPIGHGIPRDEVEFIWETNPLASYYHVEVHTSIGQASDGDFQIIDYFDADYVVQPDGTLLAPEQPYFYADHYTWSVYAYTEAGDCIGRSSGIGFWVI
jgi:hypothetical protein